MIIGSIPSFRIVKLHGFDIGINSDLDGPFISKWLEGHYEANEIKAVQEIVRSEDRVLELGAGIGVVTCVIAAIVGSEQVVSYEPNPVSARRARQNLKANGFDVPVRQRLCRPRSFASSSTVFYVAKAFWASSLSDVWEANRWTTEERSFWEAHGWQIRKKIDVDVEPLEAALQGHQTNVLVMDIEGGEVEILESADLTSLRAIIMETHPSAVGQERTDAAIRTACETGFVVDPKLTQGKILVLERRMASGRQAANLVNTADDAQGAHIISGKTEALLLTPTVRSKQGPVHESTDGMALGSAPDLISARLDSAQSKLDINRPMEALAGFNSVLKSDPTEINALFGRACALRAMGQIGFALVAVEEVLESSRSNTRALILKSELLLSSGNYEAALEATKLIKARPNNAEGNSISAMALVKLRRLNEAIATIDEAISLAPGEPENHVTRGEILGEMGRFDERWAALETAQKLGAKVSVLFPAMGLALAETGDHAGAVAVLERATRLEPENANSHESLAYAYLRTGRLQEAWPHFEWRLKNYHPESARYGHLAPKWHGEDIAGKRLLVYGERGHGDTIQFLRFLSFLEGRGAEITVVVQEPLRGFLSENFNSFEFERQSSLRKRSFDYQIALLSLPSALNISIDTIPCDMPILRAGAEYAKRWREKIGDRGYKVGIVWQGNPRYAFDSHRSIPLESFSPLARVPHVRLISLQFQNELNQLNDLPNGMIVERLGEAIADGPDGYREVAGAMANLDLIVTSDTGPAHLAGAMGLPVWVALRDWADWRWLIDRQDSPWYPTMRLFRQKTRGDWGIVFDEIASSVRDTINDRKLR